MKIVIKYIHIYYMNARDSIELALPFRKILSVCECVEKFFSL